MLATDAASELLETTLNISAEPYLTGACSFLDIAEDQVQLVSDCFTLDILLDALQREYDASEYSASNNNDRQALLFTLLVLTTRGGTGVPLENAYIAMQLLARLVPNSPFIDIIFCTFAGAISSGMTLLEHISIQTKARSRTSVSQAGTRRSTQKTVNSQSSVGSQEDYNLFADIEMDPMDTTASPDTTISAIITALNAMTTFFHKSLNYVLHQNTLTYLRSIASETIARLLNKPLKHTTYIEAPTPLIIKAVFGMLEALMSSSTTYRGILLYDFVRLLVLNPHGKYKVVSSLTAESVSLVQTLSHKCLCDVLLPSHTTGSLSPKYLETLLSNYLPVLQFSLLSIHDLSAIRLCGASATTRLIDAMLCTFDTMNKEIELLSKYQRLFFTRLISFLSALVNQPKISHKLAVIDLLAALFVNKAICSRLEAYTDLLEQICLDILFSLVCDQDDSVSASTLSLLTRSYSDKTISRCITLLLYPLCLVFTLSFRANIKLHLVILSVTLRKATTYFLGSCIIYDTSKLLDAVIPRLHYSDSDSSSDNDELSRDEQSLVHSDHNSQNSGENNAKEDDPLSLSMLNDSVDNGLAPPYQEMLEFLNSFLSKRGRDLLYTARKQLYTLLNSLRINQINVSIKDILLDELSVRCQDSSPIVRKLAITTMLECANVIPLSLWFECVFNSRSESLDSSTNTVLDHAMEILFCPILDCLRSSGDSDKAAPRKISPLFGGILFHLAPKSEGAEQHVTLTSLSYTIRNVLKQHSMYEYLQVLGCATDTRLKPTQTDQVACGALILAIGCIFMLIHCYTGTLIVDDAAAICMPFSYIAPLAATGSIGPVGLATIYNPVLLPSFEIDTIGVGLSYLFLSCISLLSDFLQNGDRQCITNFSLTIDIDNLAKIFLQKLDILFGLLDIEQYVFSDSAVLIMKNIMEGVVCFLHMHQLSNVLSSGNCKRLLIKCVPLIDISIRMLYTVLPELMDTSKTNSTSVQLVSNQETQRQIGRDSFTFAYVDAVIAQTSYLSQIVQICVSIFSDEELPSSIHELQRLLITIQSSVLTRLQSITIRVSKLLERKSDTYEPSSISSVIQQLTEGLALESTEITDIHNHMPPTCQLHIHVLRNIVSKGLLEYLGGMQSVHFNNICFGVASLIGDFRAYMTELIHKSNEKESQDLHLATKLLQLCDNLSGTVVSCIGYHALHLDPLKEASTLTTYILALSHIALKHCSPQARNNSLLAIMSLCYLVPDVAGSHLLILLPLVEEHSLLIRRQLLLVISDLLLKEYLRKEPVLVLALYSLIAHETNYEFRLFARRVCIEPILRKVPSFISHSFLDVLLMLSGSRGFIRDPINLIAFKLLETTSFSASEKLQNIYNTESENELHEKLFRTLSLQSSTQRYDFYVFLLGLTSPPKRFEILSILLKEFLDKIDSISMLSAMYYALDDILRLLIAGFFEYKVDTLSHQLPDSQHSQDDTLSAEKATLVANVIVRLSDKYSLCRLLPALLQLYSLCRDNQMPIAVKLSEAIHSVLRRSKMSIVDLKEAYPQFGAELLELRLLGEADGAR